MVLILSRLSLAAAADAIGNDIFLPLSSYRMRLGLSSNDTRFGLWSTNWISSSLELSLMTSTDLGEDVTTARLRSGVTDLL